MDQPRIERVLALMKIMSGKETFTVDELADMMGTSYRSIYRYIDTFREVGFIMEKIQGNTYRIVKMPASFKEFDKLMYFSDEESYVLNGLIESLDENSSFKKGLRKKLSAIYDRTAALKDGKTAVAVKIQALTDAMDGRKKVILCGYESANSNQKRDRVVEPFAFTGGCQCIWAFDTEKKENRIFKLSRIGKVNILDEDWSFEGMHQEGFTDAFRMSSTERYHVKLGLTLRSKNLLLEEYPLAEQGLSLVDGRWYYEGEVASLAGVGRFVLGLAAEVEIIDSAELFDYISAYIKGSQIASLAENS